MKMDLDARLVAAIGKFRAKNDLRFYLEGVYVKPCHLGGVIIAGTDGRKMGVWHDKSGHVDRPAILRTGTRLLAACAGRGKLRLTLVDKRLTVSGSKGVAESFVQSRQGTKDNDWEIEATYPNIYKVLPNLSGAPTLHGAFNPKLLSHATEALATGSSERHVHVRLMQAPGDGGAIYVVSPGVPEFACVIMPVHGDPVSPALPAWLTPPAQEAAVAQVASTETSTA